MTTPSGEHARDDLEVLKRLPRERHSIGPASWWGRAFRRSGEELALGAGDVAEARRLARSGRLGAIVCLPGMASVVVDPGRDQAFLAQLKVTRLDDLAWRRVVEVAAGESGFVAALESGDLPEELVEQADESGVELLPGPGDLETSCDCDAWAQPCRHALALVQQLARQIDSRPWLLFCLRGRVREQVLSDLAEATTSEVVTDGALDVDGDRDDAAHRAEQILGLAADAPRGHGLDPAVAAYDAEVRTLVGSAPDTAQGDSQDRRPE